MTAGHTPEAEPSRGTNDFTFLLIEIKPILLTGAKWSWHQLHRESFYIFEENLETKWLIHTEEICIMYYSCKNV